MKITKMDDLLKLPIGEIAVYRVLTLYNIKFEQQKTFSDCVNNITNNKLRFDFHLPEFNTCIEFDEFHHFENHCNYEEVKRRDEIKNRYCKDNGIGLIRIKYNQIFDIKSILNIYNIRKDTKYLSRRNSEKVEMELKTKVVPIYEQILDLCDKYSQN